MMSTLLKKHNFDTVFDSQKVFRLILEAVSNPARVVSINEYAVKLFGGEPLFLAVAMTLLDNEVSFCVCGGERLSDEIASLTLARREQTETADFIFVCNPADIKNITANIKCGTLADPHKSATVVIRNNGSPDCQLILSGPGICGYTLVRVTDLVRDCIILRDEQHYEYPQGVDFIFISDNGGLQVIPRLTRVVG